MGEDDLCRGDAEDEDEAGGGDDVANETFDFAHFAAGGVGVDVFGEDGGEDGEGRGKKCREGLQGHDGAEFLGADIFGDEPESDESLDAIAEAAGEENHRGVPPEVADLGMEFFKHGGVLSRKRKVPRLVEARLKGCAAKVPRTNERAYLDSLGVYYTIFGDEMEVESGGHWE